MVKLSLVTYLLSIVLADAVLYAAAARSLSQPARVVGGVLAVVATAIGRHDNSHRSASNPFRASWACRRRVR